MSSKEIKTFEEFYPYYLSEHQHTTSRVLHFTGTLLFFIALGIAIYFGWTWQWVFLPVIGYGFAWVGHFFFEKNKPATFQYPLWSLRSDFKLFFEILRGKKAFHAEKDHQ
ncbi:DUF962 domain-containing protein [Algivirga pacifica]